MKIAVRLQGELARQISADRIELDLCDGSTIAQVVAALGLRPGQVWLAMVDGILVEADRPLQPGDELTLIPPVGGGA